MDFEILGPLRDVETIAVTQSIRAFARLQRQYGRARWRKRKAIATIRLTGGRVREAEVQWYEATGIGKRELKIKCLLA